MRNRLGGELMRAVSRFAIVGVIGGLTAACSTDRFASNQSFSNPFSSGGSDPVRTGSVTPESPRGRSLNPDTNEDPIPHGSVQSRPVAPIQVAPIAPPATSSAMPGRSRTASGSAGWSTAGGTTVIVGPGETLSTLTSRYGVPGEAILSSNGLKAGDVTAGRRVVIPVYSATGEGAAPARRAEATPAPVRYNTPAAPAASPRIVASRKIEVVKPAPRTVAEAAPPKSQLRPGRPVAKAPEPPHPAARVAEAKPAHHAEPARVASPKSEPKAAPKVARAEPKVEPKSAKVEPKAAKAEPKVAKLEPKVAKVEPKVVAQKEIVLPARKVAKAEPASKPEAQAKVAAVSPKAVEPKSAEPVKASAREPDSTASIAPAAPAAAPASSGGSGDFRWPARGRVISAYGGGGGNEGINIAVPEGTSVKAAGDGVVAYAGSEVKGYGNLVLIRHDNGYVSAYANNGQIDVKRGQRVTRGQAIAKSGQTGNVTSPQLHFEIRKGSTPVDPMKYLASAE